MGDRISRIGGPGEWRDPTAAAGIAWGAGSSEINTRMLRLLSGNRYAEGASGRKEAPGRGLLGHAMMYFDLNGKKGIGIAKEVKWQLYNATFAKFDKDSRVDYGVNEDGAFFGYAHLPAKDLTVLLRILNSYDKSLKQLGKKSVFSHHVFAIKDFMLKNAYKDPELGREYLDALLELDDENLSSIRAALEKTCLGSSSLSSAPLFHQLEAKGGGGASRLRDFKISKREVEPAEEGTKRKLNVIRAALENERDKVGGIGSVIQASAAAHRAMGLENLVGCYPLYTHHHNLDLEFKGTVIHEFNGEMIESSVYWDTEKRNFLVQPPKEKIRLFDVANKKNIYANFEDSANIDRYMFMASALGVIAATYAGEDGHESFDVLHADAWHTGGPAIELIATRLNKMRVEAGLPKIGMLYLTHMLVGDPIEQGLRPTSDLDKIGADVEGYGPEVNLTASALMKAPEVGISAFVSEGVKRDALSDNPYHNKSLNIATAGERGINLPRVLGIRNGIDTSMFDVTNPSKFGRFIPGGVDAEGRALKRAEELTGKDYIDNQKEIKQELYNAGIIAHPDKPLLTFVGRYSSEKGIDQLPTILEQVKRKGGQMVVMGVKQSDAKALRIVNELKRLSKTAEYADCLKVYDNLADQLGNFVDKTGEEHIGVRKGWLIRAASTFVSIPSHAEACGLVPMEAHCTGAITIAPYIQGLRDMCIPFQRRDLAGRAFTFSGDPSLAHANSIVYDESRLSDQVARAVSTAFDVAEEMLAGDGKMMGSYMKRARDGAVKSYGWVISDKEGLPRSGAAVNYSAAYRRIAKEYVPVENRDERLESQREAFDRVRQQKISQMIRDVHALGIRSLSNAQMGIVSTVEPIVKAGKLPNDLFNRFIVYLERLEIPRKDYLPHIDNLKKLFDRIYGEHFPNIDRGDKRQVIQSHLNEVLDLMDRYIDRLDRRAAAGGGGDETEAIKTKILSLFSHITPLVGDTCSDTIREGLELVRNDLRNDLEGSAARVFELQCSEELITKLAKEITDRVAVERNIHVEQRVKFLLMKDLSFPSDECIAEDEHLDLEAYPLFKDSSRAREFLRMRLAAIINEKITGREEAEELVIEHITPREFQERFSRYQAVVLTDKLQNGEDIALRDAFFSWSRTQVMPFLFEKDERGNLFRLYGKQKEYVEADIQRALEEKEDGELSEEELWTIFVGNVVSDLDDETGMPIINEDLAYLFTRPFTEESLDHYLKSTSTQFKQSRASEQERLFTVRDGGAGGAGGGGSVEGEDLTIEEL